jgi:hypothetical protein
MERRAHDAWNLRFKPYRKFLVEQVSLLIVGLGRGVACLCTFNIGFRDFENRVSSRFFQLLLLEHPSCAAKKITTCIADISAGTCASKECKRAGLLCAGSAAAKT